MDWRKILRQGPEPVSKNDSAQPPQQLPSPYFRVGEAVPYDGVYRAFHADHRTSHEVTLLAGQTFPRCVQCGFAVHFELMRAVPLAVRDSQFQIHLYEIPHPDDEKEPAA